MISFGDQRIISNRVNKKQNVEIDSPVSSGCQGKYMKYVSFPWPPLETALSIFTLTLFLNKHFFEKGLIKTNEIAFNA